MGDIAQTDALTTMSVAFWTKPTSLAEFKCIVCKYSDGYHPGWGFQSSRSGIGGAANIMFWVSSNGSQYGYSTSNPLVAGAWVHVAGVFAGGGADNAARLKLYINGAQTSLTYEGTVQTSVPSTAYNLIVGSDNALVRMYNGIVDDVCLWNRVLSASEIAEMYTRSR